MAQSIFEQHEVLDQLFVELKRSYQLGKMPSLEQLQQIAPELSFEEALTQLENIVRELESGRIRLSQGEMLRFFSLSVLSMLMQIFFLSRHSSPDVSF